MTLSGTAAARPKSGSGSGSGGAGLDGDACYRALVAHDARFDGLFFVGVTTTGVYCRPVCRARTAARARCVFFRLGAQAEREGFRACFRCRPELAPGTSSTDAISRLVATAVARIEAGALDEEGLDDLAAELGVTARHLRRAMQQELGVSPIELAQSTRLALAKQLLQDGGLPITQVAFASGFASVRRFNALVRARFGRPPSAIRRGSHEHAPAGVTLALGYREPFAWPAVLRFLDARAVPGVEHVDATGYARTARIGQATGWFTARRDAERGVVRLLVSPSLSRVLLKLAAGVRALFDLEAEPALVDAHLAGDPRLAPLVAKTPGLRVPGAFDPFELAVRAVLGQQVSVAAATTIAGRIAARFGDPIETSVEGLDRLFPTAEQLAAASVDELASVGLPRARATTVRALAEAVVAGKVVLSRGADPECVGGALLAVPGIGRWTAAYVAMRALGDPDGFPEGDLGLKAALGATGAGEVRECAEVWRPWRAYGAMHLWNERSREENRGTETRPGPRPRPRAAEGG